MSNHRIQIELCNRTNDKLDNPSQINLLSQYQGSQWDLERHKHTQREREGSLPWNGVKLHACSLLMLREPCWFVIKQTILIFLLMYDLNCMGNLPALALETCKMETKRAGIPKMLPTFSKYFWKYSCFGYWHSQESQISVWIPECTWKISTGYSSGLYKDWKYPNAHS